MSKANVASIYFPDSETLKRLQIRAEEKNVSVSAIVYDLVCRYLAGELNEVFNNKQSTL